MLKDVQRPGARVGKPSALAALAGAAMALLVAACGAPGIPLQAGLANPAVTVPGYRLVMDLPMPGSPSRWEYAILDSASGRLYLAHLGTSQVVVVDTARPEVVTTVPGIDSVHGLALAPRLGLLYASASGSDQVAVIDMATAQVVARVPAGPAPNGLAFVSSPDRLFVSDEHGTGDTVIDTLTDRPRSTVELGPGVGESQYDPWSGRVLVTVAGRHELVALDPQSEAIVARYPLPGCEGADAVQVDVSGRDRAFVDCSANARLVGVDLDTGLVSPAVEVGDGPDVLALDPALHRLYVASESGVLTVVATDGADLQVVASGAAGPDAHSVAVDPDTHLLYLPLASVDGRPVLRVLAPA
jgi:YVTN family beta-propeller protein